MSTPLRVTVFTTGGVLLAGAIGTAVMVGLTFLSAHDVRASTRFDLAGDTLTIYSDGGGVHLTPSDETGVVHVDRKTTESINGADPKWSMRDGKLTLDTNCPGFMDFTCDGDYDVTVPRTITTVIVRNDNGSISADHMAAATFDLRSDNGSIRLRDSVATEAILESDNGSIGVERSWVTKVNAKSDNGGLRVALNNEPESVKGESDNGSIRLTLPLGNRYYNLKLDTDNGGKDDGDVKQTSDPQYPINLSSDNGSVKVKYSTQQSTPAPARP